jgi:hypothetical protein
MFLEFKHHKAYYANPQLAHFHCTLCIPISGHQTQNTKNTFLPPLIFSNYKQEAGKAPAKQQPFNIFTHYPAATLTSFPPPARLWSHQLSGLQKPSPWASSHPVFSIQRVFEQLPLTLSSGLKQRTRSISFCDYYNPTCSYSFLYSSLIVITI